jgi:hypothetical protein
MRRVLYACLTACMIAVAPAGATASSPPRSALEDFACLRAPNALNRAIEVTAVMRPVSGTQAMSMKFVLVRRPASGGPFTAVAGKELGRWLTPTPPSLGQRPGDVWRLNKVVVNLASPYVYRLRVTFRWTGKSEAPLGRTLLSSPLCAQ